MSNMITAFWFLYKLIMIHTFLLAVLQFLKINRAFMQILINIYISLHQHIKNEKWFAHSYFVSKPEQGNVCILIFRVFRVLLSEIVSVCSLLKTMYYEHPFHCLWRLWVVCHQHLFIFLFQCIDPMHFSLASFTFNLIFLFSS